MKRLTSKQRDRELQARAALPDDQIDTSDIPELTEEQMRGGVRGLFYRPLKKPVTIRLDVDIIEWLKRGGRGYQTKANALLRREMIRSLDRKSPASAGKNRRRKASSR
jgi:uncharacterized protein (DUF4415 family)